MINELNFETLLSSGLIPLDCLRIDNSLFNSTVVTGPNDSNYCFIRLNLEIPSKFSDYIEDDYYAVVENYSWVAYSKSTGIIYSSDNEFIYSYRHLSSEIGEFIKYLPKGKLIPINRIKVNRRNDKMSGKSNDVKERIANLKKMQGEKGTQGSPVLDNSNAFGGAPTSTGKTEEDKLKDLEKDAKFKALDTAIRNLSSGENLKDTSDLYAYNQPRSTIIGWITDRDIRLHAKAEAKTIPDPVTGKPKVKDNAPQDIKDLLAEGKRPAREYLEESVKIKVNQVAPGAAKYAILEMPVDGIIPINKLRDTNFELTVDFKSHSDKVIKFYNKKEFVATTISLLGGSIREDERTHTEPSVVTAFLRAKPVTDKETGRTENRLNPYITVASKRKLITATNYFPKTTFASLRLDEINTQEKIEQADLSLFGHLFKSVAGKPTPYSRLDASEKAKLHQENGKVVSKFFDPSESLSLDVKSVFTGASIANPAIPLKEEVPTKDGKGTRLVPVSFDVTKSVEDPYNINPFNDERFARILDACGGKLTREVITELYSKSKKTKKRTSTSGIVLSAEEATNAILNAAVIDADGNYSLLKNIQFSQAFSHDELKEYSEDALKSFSAYYAE